MWVVDLRKKADSSQLSCQDIVPDTYITEVVEYPNKNVSIVTANGFRIVFDSDNWKKILTKLNLGIVK